MTVGACEKVGHSSGEAIGGSAGAIGTNEVTVGWSEVAIGRSEKVGHNSEEAVGRSATFGNSSEVGVGASEGVIGGGCR